jgi:hypothetical protein
VLVKIGMGEGKSTSMPKKDAPSVLGACVDVLKDE